MDFFQFLNVYKIDQGQGRYTKNENSGSYQQPYEVAPRGRDSKIFCIGYNMISVLHNYVQFCDRPMPINPLLLEYSAIPFSQVLFALT